MTEPTSEQTEHLSVLEDLSGMLFRAKTNFKKCPKSRFTPGYIKARVKTLEDYWNSFKVAHDLLLKCTPRVQRRNIPYFANEEFFTMEEVYLSLCADLNDLLSTAEEQRRMKDSSSPGGSHCLSKLPSIQLPVFSGKYEDWPTYQDLFQALVHNTNLNDVQKLHYLKTSVSGEAETLLRHISITEDNYSQAWQLLKTRFGNKKMIVNSILKRLFGQRKVSNQSATQIKSLLDTTTECLNNLKNLKIDIDSWDPVIIFLVSQKLDTELLKDWEQHTYNENSEEMSTWETLTKFLESKFRTLELVTPATSFSREKTTTHKSYHVMAEEIEDETFYTQSSHASVTPKVTCTYCNENHYLFNCKEFAKQPVEQRQAFVKKNYLCFNCLIPNHIVYRCKQKTACRVCKGRHHSLLHHTRDTKHIEKKDEESQPEQKITTAHFSKEQSGHEVLLATAQVEVKSSDGQTHLIRALIDQGSEASFVSARVVELLGLKRKDINGVVSGVGEGNDIPIKHLVELPIRNRFNTNEELRVKAYVLKTISNKLPSKHVTMLDWPELQSLNLADMTYYKSGKIDMLLGADVFCKIIEDGLIKLPDGMVAQKTTLGWILSGQRENTEKINTTQKLITLHVTTMVAEDNDLLRKFWEIETDVYKKKKILTKEEEMCEEIYNETTVKDNGRYIVHLPLKQSVEETVKLCGETKEQATKRFLHLEKRFGKDENLKIEYTKVIKEYIEMGHLRKSDTENEARSIYLPHHAIIREDKDTTKTRVVFDASAKGSNGNSLNDTMMVGPVLQPDLRSLIIAWRTHKICVVGDIVKMYRMINMTEEHSNLQRIVWRDHPNEELESYTLTTVTFGTAAAPYLAVRTLHQLADDETPKHPNTAPLIKKIFYMDDLMFGEEDTEKTKKVCEEIKTIMKEGGFEMQKWSSNSEEVLETLQEKEKSKDRIDIKLDKVIKILGLTWNRKEDVFEIKVNLPELKQPITKRSILSDVARLFDPFGWVSPVIITAKILIQKLWLCSLSWDDELPENLIQEWISFRGELIHLQNIKVPRWMKTQSTNENVELHGFADASTQAYAAVAYLKVINNEDAYVTMIASRTKVAPLKQVSVPRLELCAAALLAELINDLVDILQIPKNKTFAWTDSMVVLSWLQSPPSRWRVFVANRVADITRIIDNDRWRHVQSAENPADIATRGSKARDLPEQELWWSGPKWLKEKEIEMETNQIPQTELEVKNTFHGRVENKEIEDSERPEWERFSSMSRMKRVLAICKRWLKIKEPEARMTTSYLTPNELEDIVENCIIYYQRKIYGKEIEELSKDGRVKKRSSLNTLSPFLDEKGLIRVAGRLQNAPLPDMTKHPIIIPANQHITKLIVNEAHTKTLHGGNQQMMAYVRTRYWIVGLKSAVRKCVRTCKTCIIDKAKVKTQLMGQLPTMRVTPSRAFINSGVDYAGPVLLRTSKGRGYHATKGYICLFVCMATKAIHLEAVTDLTSQAFIAAFRRFVARRGHCLHLWSDNATNFVGAAKELKTLFEMNKNNLAKEVAELIANEGTIWHFIPPRMPNYGGIWEAGIQSAKRHLHRVNKDTKLTFEEMSTLLAQIEACLNSRPLCRIDEMTETPLTPGHFLVGEPLISVPDLNYKDQKMGLLSRWQLIQRLIQDFWHHWRTDYLHTLQQKYKWHVAVPSPAVGDIVMIKDEDVPPTKWLLGKIKYLHPGSDNLVRVVTVQCKGNNELKRPLSKIIPLPKQDS